MGDSKQVRVDNWGIFFLQRLQIFFSKTDYCDLTLQFDGNVQLKVHRLVMNACTEYFQMLEQTCEMNDNVLLMPPDLQADVVLPIVNFMYTGILEFNSPIFEKLYKTAKIMNMTVLIKLLDAQKLSIAPTPKIVKKTSPVQPTWNIPERKYPKVENCLPTPLPGRKLPVWKRKKVSSQNKISSHYFTEQKRQAMAIDPLAIDNTPKPSRFEWPEEELPGSNLFESNFDDISYSSKPLFTQNDEAHASTSFDSVMIKEDIPIEEDDTENLENEQADSIKNVNKRKADFKATSGKRVCLTMPDNQNKQTPKVSVSPTNKSTSSDIDHAKIISEVLKKYPSLVKKNKNIRLKILAKSNNTPVAIKQAKLSSELVDSKTDNKDENGPWQCKHCSTPTEPVEFVLYYLYRKHMSDVHFEKFDSRMCKFCGHKSNKHTLLMYHQYTKHGIKPPLAYNFPKCDQCPYIAMSEAFLIKHKSKHNKTELQCVDCHVAFSNQPSLALHMQITGHTGKLAKPNYDCQYCAKKCQSSNVLFVHIRQHHRDEARRDGIVSIDEALDDEEYILPEQLCDNRKDRIKILSDVKLPTALDVQQQEVVTLEPSSEAEALNNVATGIATSLGLVDVVVLDDNQQYILHSDNQQGMSESTSEFILPDLQDTPTFGESHHVVASRQNVAMLHNTELSSTDELVMVLTDQDYSNGNGSILDGDHSNIVVLYSHPVECQNNQFLSAGNIVLTSQSGLIGLQSTNTIVPANSSTFIATPSQETPSAEIESIELIQKEINGQSSEKLDLKDDETATIQEEFSTLDGNLITPAEEYNDQTMTDEPIYSEEPCLIPSTNKAKESEDSISNEIVDTKGTISISGTIESVVNVTECILQSAVEHTDDISVIQPEITDTLSHIANVMCDEVTLVKEQDVKNENETQSTIDDQTAQTLIQTENDVALEGSLNDISNSETILDDSVLQQVPGEKNTSFSNLHGSSLLGNSQDEPVSNIDFAQVSDSQEDLSQASTEDVDVLPHPKVALLEDSTHQSQSEERNTSQLQENNSLETASNCEPAVNNLEDSRANKQHEKVGKKLSSINPKMARTILDDWEDTDSQQSDSRNTVNVHKLIDDWDDEEEDCKKISE